MGQGVIPDDWEGEYCCYTVEWPDSPQWLAVLRGVLHLPATGRFWDEHTGVITDAQLVIKNTEDTNLHLTEVLMSCNDNISTALNNIAIALSASVTSNNGGGCCQTGKQSVQGSIQAIGTQPVGGNDIPIYGSEQPITITEETIPDGYDTLEEYQADKCRKANSLVNAMIASLRALGALSAFNFAGLTVLALMAISGVLVIAPELVPVLIGALVILAVSMSVLDTAADGVEANKQEWVCVLYNGNSAEVIVTSVADLLDVLVAGLSVTGVVGGAVKLVVLVLLNADNINKLLTNAPMLGITELDCTECVGCENLLFDFEDDTAQGWESVGVFPSCFGLNDPDPGSITIVDGVLNLDCALYISSPLQWASGLRITGLDFLAEEGYLLDVTLRITGATALYCDVVYIMDDASCIWGTVNNAWAQDSEFTTSGQYAENAWGKRINELWLFFQSNQGATSLNVELDKVELVCP